MIAALAARDGAAMRAVLTEHLLLKRDTVLELLRAGNSKPQQSLGTDGHGQPDRR